MEKKIQTTVVFWGCIDNGKENTNYYSILGFYWEKNGYILNAVLHLEVRCTENQLSSCGLGFRGLGFRV